MACNFLRRWLLRCFGGDPDNQETSIQGYNGSENMCDFIFRWLIPENLEAWTIESPSTGNSFSEYYWQNRLARHLYGQFSMAVVPANLQNEDRSQLVSGSLTGGVRGVFVGIYDGHGGTTCSQFVLDHLFHNLKSGIANHNGVNPEVIQGAYQRTEETFVNYVRNNWQLKPRLAVLGSCCLVGVVYNNVLYVANAGDSRAVLARWPNRGGLDDMEVIQLSVNYNAKHIERRDEVCVDHPPGTIFFTELVPGCFRVMWGSVQVTRAIGHVYLKYDEFNRAPLPAHHIQEEPIALPILKAEPMVRTHQLGPDDRFVIFASDGLWDEITNEEAAALVRNNPRDGAAAMLMREVLNRAAHKHDMRYLDPRSFEPSDISIVILFFDNLLAPAPAPAPS